MHGFHNLQERLIEHMKRGKKMSIEEIKPKISNELLSSVLGCECEFDKILSNEIIFISNAEKIFDINGITPFMGDWKINLDTFIFMAICKDAKEDMNETRLLEIKDLEESLGSTL